MATETELAAGRELDALVAVRFGGFEWRPYQWYDGSTKQLLWHRAWKDPRGDDFDRLEDGRVIPWDLPAYSTDIAAAWQVVEKTTNAFGLLILVLPGCVAVQYTAAPLGGPQDRFEVKAETAPLAICRAALRVVAGA